MSCQTSPAVSSVRIVSKAFKTPDPLSNANGAVSKTTSLDQENSVVQPQLETISRLPVTDRNMCRL